MPLISETLPTLTGGVSQRAAQQRDSSQGTRQINGVSSPVFGLMKRPPTHHLATLSRQPDVWNGAHYHPLSLDFDKRYRLIFTAGDLFIFDALTNTPVQVSFPAGKGYLDTLGADAASAFRCVTAGARTFVLNRSKSIGKATVQAPARPYEALIVVRAAQAATRYAVTVDTRTVAITTHASTTADSSEGTTAGTIAAQLREALQYLPNLIVEQFGATLYLTRTDSADFKVSVSDEVANDGLLLIKNSVQRIEQLPEKAKDGFVVEVVGDATSEADNAWYAYDASSQNWKESLRPGEITSLDSSTMPHELVSAGSLIADTPHHGSPPAPAIEAFGDIMFALRWATTQGGSPSTASVFKMELADTEMFARLSNSPDTGATPTYVTAVYNVATASLKPGNYATVSLFVNSAVGGTDWTLMAAKVYEAGQDASEETLAGLVNTQADFDVKLVLSYATAPTENLGLPVDNFVTVTMYPAGLTHRFGTYELRSQQRVTFPSDAIYPGGREYALWVNSVGFGYTPLTDVTAAQLASGLSAVIDASSTFVSRASGSSLEIAWTTLSPPPVVWAAGYDRTKTFHGVGMNLTVNALIGATLTNLSDNSTGTVISNTEATVTVSGLSGGTRNYFAEGDRVSVVIPGGDSFVFRPVEWEARKVGTLKTNPFPSFTDLRASEVFVHRGRLGICAGNKVVCSVAGDFTNFFRKTVSGLLDSDPVDVDAGARESGSFHSAASIDERLFLISDRNQFELQGEPVLSPKTVALKHLTSYASSPQVRPVATGRQLVFGYDNLKHARIMLFGAVADATQSFEAADITLEVPRYLEGKLRQLVGFEEASLLFALTEGTNIGLLGLTDDSYLDGARASVPPAPAAPVVVAPSGAGTDQLAAENELLDEAEAVTDTSGFTEDTVTDTDTASTADAAVEATDVLLPQNDKSQSDTITATDAEAVEDSSSPTADSYADSDRASISDVAAKSVDYTGASVTSITILSSGGPA